MSDPAASTIAAVALGANLGDRLESFRRARTALSELGTVLASSRVYESPALGPPQPDYLNAVVLLETTLEAEALLERLLEIERRLGRERRERWGPRPIDLDLVAYGEQVLDAPRLKLPHPEAHRRPFVLLPLADVAPALLLPGYGPAAELLDAIPEAERAHVRPVLERW